MRQLFNRLLQLVLHHLQYQQALLLLMFLLLPVAVAAVMIGAPEVAVAVLFSDLHFLFHRPIPLHFQ
jgi:hypothetical protein